MKLLRRDSEASVTRRLTEAGAPHETAEAIVATLLGCGLGARDAREWLSHPELGYPIQRPVDMGDGHPIVLSQGPMTLVERGEAEVVLDAAREFAAALPEERLIARLFWGDIDAARRLTGCDPHRTRVVAGIATTLLQRLRKPELVCNVGQTVLPGHDGKRMVDRLAAGEAEAVAAELADGRIDARALERNGELIFTGW
jgi:hypothetical protein